MMRMLQNSRKFILIAVFVLQIGNVAVKHHHGETVSSPMVQRSISFVFLFQRKRTTSARMLHEMAVGRGYAKQWIDFIDSLAT